MTNSIHDADSPESAFRQFGEVYSRPMGRFQKVIARRLSENSSNIPHVTHHDEIDISSVELARRSFRVRTTALVFVIKAMAAALKEFPTFNSSLSADGTTLILKNYFHIGVAVDGPLGLLVPVIRNCETKTLADLSAQLAALTAQARSKGLPMEAMMGASMSVSSLGAIGGTGFTPLINAPEVAILGVARSQVKPVWDGVGFSARTMLPLSLSYDHRVINGADAARFLRYLEGAMQGLASERIEK